MMSKARSMYTSFKAVTMFHHLKGIHLKKLIKFKRLKFHLVEGGFMRLEIERMN